MCAYIHSLLSFSQFVFLIGVTRDWLVSCVVDFSQMVICQIRFLSTVNLPILFNIYWNCFSLKKVKQMFWSHFFRDFDPLRSPHPDFTLPFFVSFYFFLPFFVHFCHVFVLFHRTRKGEKDKVPARGLHNFLSFSFFRRFLSSLHLFSSPLVFFLGLKWTKKMKQHLG